MSLPRASIVRFACEMEKKLERDDKRGKPDWREEDMNELLLGVADELIELCRAVSKGDPEEVHKEAADVANYAMMVSDVFKEKVGHRGQRDEDG